MAIESKRGCGYRKGGGTYVVSGNFWSGCDRLPFPLTVCPCCGEGYRPSRALREIDPVKMLGDHENCECGGGCYICHPQFINLDVSHYLEWIGGSFYKDHTAFVQEARELGISRRLKGGVPRGLVVGKTVFYLAHREILFTKRSAKIGGFTRGLFERGPGIFTAFVAQGIEHICTESEYSICNRCKKDEGIFEAIGGKLIKRIKSLINMEARGVKLISVPDDDPDHK